MLKKSKLGVGLLATTMAIGGCTPPTYERLNAVEGGYALTATARLMDVCPTEMLPTTTIISTPALNAQAVHESAPAPLSGLATDFALNLIGSGLETAIQGRDGQFVALGTFGTPDHSGGNGKPNCLVIYRGLRGDLDENNVGEGLENNVLTALGLADQPGFYLELNVRQQGGYRVLSVNHLQYAETSAIIRGSGRKTVTVAIGLVPTVSENADLAKATEIYRFDLGRLGIGHTYGPELAASAASKKGSDPVYNVVVRVVESDQPNLALQALADAFKGNRDEIAAALQN